MWTTSRRALLGRLLSVLPAWPFVRITEARLTTPEKDSSEDSGSTLRALAEIVLPASELGDRGLDRAIADFASWSAGFQPEAELDHPYLWSDELRYGPVDPRPAWEQQLRDFDRAAREADGADFSDLEVGARRELVVSALEGIVPERLGPPSEAEHIALALLSWFFRTSAANDLCYRAEIGRHVCRGLPSVVEEPVRLEGQVR